MLKSIKPKRGQAKKLVFSFRNYVTSNSDLGLLVVLALLSPLVVGLPRNEQFSLLVRLPFGLVMVLLAPGYALAAALFTRFGWPFGWGSRPFGWSQENIADSSRVGLSFGLSVVVLLLFALVMNLLPWGIQPSSMLMALNLWTITLSVIAAFRRWRRNEQFPNYVTGSSLPSFSIRLAVFPLRGWWRDKLVYLGGLLFVLLVGSYAAWGFLNSSAGRNPAEQFTEFYALGSNGQPNGQPNGQWTGQAENYPYEVIAGQEVQVQLGLVNHEGVAATYRIEIRQDGRTLSTGGSTLAPVTLQPGEKWEQFIRLSSPTSRAASRAASRDNQLTRPAQPTSPNNQKVDFILFYNDNNLPYRQLHLWINVQENDTASRNVTNRST